MSLFKCFLSVLHGMSSEDNDHPGYDDEKKDDEEDEAEDWFGGNGWFV